jgi:hypothetical protein
MSHTSISTAEKVEDIALGDNTNAEENGEAEKGPTTTPTEHVGEYPKGFRLAMVILALVLSVFLVALDLGSLNISNSESA